MLEIRPSEAILKRLDSRRGGMRDLVGAAGVLGRFCAVLGWEVDDGFEVDDDALGFLGVTVDGALRCCAPLCTAVLPLFCSALCALAGDHLPSEVLNPCRKASISQSARSL